MSSENITNCTRELASIHAYIECIMPVLSKASVNLMVYSANIAADETLSENVRKELDNALDLATEGVDSVLSEWDTASGLVADACDTFSRIAGSE